MGRRSLDVLTGGFCFRLRIGGDRELSLLGTAKVGRSMRLHHACTPACHILVRWYSSCSHPLTHLTCVIVRGKFPFRFDIQSCAGFWSTYFLSWGVRISLRWMIRRDPSLTYVRLSSLPCVDVTLTESRCGTTGVEGSRRACRTPPF